MVEAGEAEEGETNTDKVEERIDKWSRWLAVRRRLIGGGVGHHSPPGENHRSIGLRLLYRVISRRSRLADHLPDCLSTEDPHLGWSLDHSRVTGAMTQHEELFVEVAPETR